MVCYQSYKCLSFVWMPCVRHPLLWLWARVTQADHRESPFTGKNLESTLLHQMQKSNVILFKILIFDKWNSKRFQFKFKVALLLSVCFFTFFFTSFFHLSWWLWLFWVASPLFFSCWVVIAGVVFCCWPVANQNLCYWRVPLVLVDRDYLRV